MILNRRDNTPVVPQEKVQKSELARLYISVKGTETDNRQDSQDINFSFTKLDRKAYDRNETIANSVRNLCKHWFEEFTSRVRIAGASAEIIQMCYK